MIKILCKATAEQRIFLLKEADSFACVIATLFWGELWDKPNFGMISLNSS